MPAKAHSDIHGRGSHGQAMPALRRCDGLWGHDPAAMRHRGRVWIVLLGLGHSRARDGGASTRAAELSCPPRSSPQRLSPTDEAAIKFNSFWTIELEPGWSLFATHPVNRDDLPFRLVSGLVDSDRFHDGGINFPAVWTKPDFSGVLERGTPVAQCFAVPRKRRNWCSRPSMTRTSKPMRRSSPTCWLRPTSTASIFARSAGA